MAERTLRPSQRALGLLQTCFIVPYGRSSEVNRPPPPAAVQVTAVGGTGSTNPEIAAYLSSGGKAGLGLCRRAVRSHLLTRALPAGFSNYWARAAYQVDAVNQYLTTAQGLPPSNRYNHTGHGFPDVAAQAESFNIVYNGYATPVDGARGREGGRG